MNVAIMQPYFMPYIGYFQLIHVADTFVIYDDVHYIKKGWINRNNLLVNNDKSMFSIPLKKVSQNKYINEIEIDNNSAWQQDLLKTISFSYKKAPFYDEVYELLKSIVQFPEDNLSKFVTHSLQEVSRYMGIQNKFILSSDLDKPSGLKGQDKIIAICKLIKATSYTNAIGGLDLYDKQLFQEHGIALRFIKPKPIVYAQFKNDFLPWLSVIDVMMFNAPNHISKLLTQYEFE